MTEPPNYRLAECCYGCKNGKGEQSRCGEYKFWCEHEKHFGEVSETCVCDDYKPDEMM